MAERHGNSFSTHPKMLDLLGLSPNLASNDKSRLAEDERCAAGNGKCENAEMERELNQARQLAIACVAFCTFALVSASLAVPALLSASLSLQADLQLETEFCRVRLRNFWSEMTRHDPAPDLQWRAKREPKEGAGGAWLFGRWIAEAQRARAHASPIVTAAATEAPVPTGGSAAVGGYGGYGALAPAPIEPAAVYGGEAVAQPASAGVSGADATYGVEISNKQPQQQPLMSASGNTYGAQPISAAPESRRSGAAPPAMQPPQAAAPEFCCCCQGAPGPAGDAGEDGEAGTDGTPGEPGQDGRSGEVLAHDVPLKEPCIICPQGPAGPMGPQGPRGPPGPRGSNGASGIDGKRGEPGMEGPPGPVGNIGAAGPQGPPGIPGRQFITEGPRGPTGKVGPKGPRGLPGCQGPPGNTVQGPKGPPGDPGRPGKDGHKGLQGANGTPGQKGPSGDCFHCPPPRTPPGY